LANEWNALVGEVNDKLAEMHQEISDANSAEALGKQAVEEANAAANAANAAAKAANDAAEEMTAEMGGWSEATVSAITRDAGSSASVELLEENGVKHFRFGIPAGRDGAEGEKGDTGESGVTFTLSGTTLHIKTVV